MFSSTIIPTIARPSLSGAVNSVLDQNFEAEDFEVIVVNDSGRPLAGADWQHSSRVRVIDTNRRERVFARNSGAALARGRYLHFLDDDDTLLPGALQSMWNLARLRDSAHWLYGSAQLVDRQGKPIIKLHPTLDGNCFVQVMAGEWIPLQASLILADAFFKVGGFTAGALVSQDVDLSRKIGLIGDFAGTNDVVACIGMGTQGSSTDYAHLPHYSRWAREKILDEPHVFTRLRSSASTSYWKGRVVRTYLTSSVWNVQHGKIFTASSRAFYGVAAIALSGIDVVASDFWRAIKGRYISPTFLRGFESARRSETRAV